MSLQRLSRIIITLILLGALITILAEYHSDRTLVYLYKPLTTVFIILLAWIGKEAAKCYRGRMIVGLLLSLIGDVFLLWPDRFFILGLVSFLLAHIFYISAFLVGRNLKWSPLILPYAVYGILIYSLLFPGLGNMRWPVLLYMVVILFMGWQALERWRTFPTIGLIGVAGAILFIVSDSLLAWNRFHTSFDTARIFILGTYYPAQLFLALSVHKDAKRLSKSPVSG